MTEIILTSSALILFLIIIRKLLRGRINPTLQYALWLLVAARLLIPGTLFVSPVSLVGTADPLLNSIEESLHPENSVPAISDAYVSTTPDTITPDAIIDYNDTVVTYYPPQATAPVITQTTNWIAEIWKLGIIAVSSTLLLSNLSFYVKLRKKRRLLSAAELPRPCRTRVYVVPSLVSPCLFGLVRPAIYLNKEALASEGLEHILIHEETHLRHGDHIWVILRSLCLAVHWYNPLVWWAALLSRRDCELSCDAGAIRRLGEESRISYGETLLHMIVPGRRTGGLLRTATTMTAEKRTMTERINLIVKRPKMLKITLAVVVLLMFAAVIFVFGGVSDEPTELNNDQITADTPGEGDKLTDTDTSNTDAPTVLTETAAVELYHQAREIWNWFAFGTLPTTNTTLQTEEGTMLQVSGFDSLDDLRRRLETYFSPALAEHLLTDYAPFLESDGKLFVLPADRGSNIYAGEETVTAFPLTGTEAAHQGYDCHVYATTEVLDFYDTETVLYQKRHDWYMAWNGQNYVFTNFGPYDDVDPQKYYNVMTILDHYNRGNTITTWFPVLANLDWNALYASQDQWPEDFDLGMYILTSISEYVAAENSLTPAVMDHILSATEGLDGAYAEQYQVIVYELYQKNPAAFAYTVLETLQGFYQTQVIDYFRCEEQYHRAPSTDSILMTREEAIALLRQNMFDLLSAAPTSMHFDQPGQREQLLSVNAYGISAASYTSSDPNVATVDDLGFVTAVNPGAATITLHYEGAGGQKDLTCAVSCEWDTLRTNTALYTHPSGIFSLSIPSKDCQIAETATGITITLDNKSWTLRLLTQPSQWLSQHPSQALVLGTFDTNGTTQTYLLETSDPDSPLTQQLAASFHLHITADMISQLVYAGLEHDMAQSIRYLPYLSWLNYREQYGEYRTGGLLDLLTALRSAADSGGLSWAQYHDLLSVLPDRAIDGAFATVYQDTLQTLHDRDPQQFASVLLSEFISPAEQENALEWLDMDLPTLKKEVVDS